MAKVPAKGPRPAAPLLRPRRRPGRAAYLGLLAAPCLILLLAVIGGWRPLPEPSSGAPGPADAGAGRRTTARGGVPPAADHAGEPTPHRIAAGSFAAPTSTEDDAFGPPRRTGPLVLLPPPPTARPAAPTQYYTVQAGDTLADICVRFNASVDAVAGANGLDNPNLLIPGQVLRIPGAAGSGTTSNPPAAGRPDPAALPPSGLPPHTPDYALLAPPSLTVDGIELILTRYHSPAQGQGAAFYNFGVQYGIDPVYALAFFVQTSHAGTRGVAAAAHAIGNLPAVQGDPELQGVRTYPTWEAGIDDWYRVMRTHYIRDLGLGTVAAILPRYEPAPDPQDVASCIASLETLVAAWDGTLPVPVLPFTTPAPADQADLLPRVYHVTSEFGHYPDGSPHYGLDLDAKLGVPQTAPVGGVVEEVHTGCLAGDSGCGRGWGNHIWWRAATTGHHILLAHFEQIDPAITVGTTIRAGTLLGLTGATGFATGPHVHIQVNPVAPSDTGAVPPGWEFPWLSCGNAGPVLDDPWGTAACQ